MMEMNQETAQDANNSFYEAFQKLSLENMEKIWKHDEDTICVHPGWELVIGWVEIRDSWVQIFQNTENITINANTLRLRKYGNLAIIICIEHLRATINGQKQKFGVLATNVYENSDGVWLLTHHHGSNGVLKPNSILTVSVNTDSERGLLGAAAYKTAGSGKTFVFLYYTEEQEGQDLRNKVYRFEWNGSLLVNPLLVLDLPALPGPNHDGGKLLIGSDRNLYVVIGGVNHRGKLQNINDGPDPDDTGVIFKINLESLTTESSSNPFSPSQTEDLHSRYVAYGIRNSFGLAMDPLTARLWETENGPDKYDEINYIRNSVSSCFNVGGKR